MYRSVSTDKGWVSFSDGQLSGALARANQAEQRADRNYQIAVINQKLVERETAFANQETARADRNAEICNKNAELFSKSKKAWYELRDWANEKLDEYAKAYNGLLELSNKTIHKKNRQIDILIDLATALMNDAEHFKADNVALREAINIIGGWNSEIEHFRTGLRENIEDAQPLLHAYKEGWADSLKEIKS